MESQTIGTTKVSAKPAANKIDENVAESMIFKTIQERLVDQFKTSFPDRLAPKTVVIIPSLTMDEEILSKVSGITHYEATIALFITIASHATHTGNLCNQHAYRSGYC